jgi:hypothetical protein
VPGRGRSRGARPFLLTRRTLLLAAAGRNDISRRLGPLARGLAFVVGLARAQATFAPRPTMSIAAKLDRAEHHLGVLEDDIGERVAEPDFMTTWTDRDRQGRVRIRVKEISQIPDDWHVRIGECVHDMRSALDHLAYGLNIIGSSKDPPPNHRASAFPIFPDQNTYRHGSRALIAHFPRGAKTRVERLQPYRGRKDDPFSPRRLSDLSELSNIDKHRRFPVTAPSLRLYQVPSSVEGNRVTHYTEQYRLLKPDTTMLWIEVPTLPRHIKEPHVDFNFTPRIELVGALANPPVHLLFPHEPVTFTLGAILDFIRVRVLPEFEPWNLR